MADSVPSEVRGFGCLYEEFDEDFFSQVVREYAVSLLTMAVERYPQMLRPDATSALSLLTSPHAAEYSPFWCPELAQCLAALRSPDPPKAARGVGQILLNLSCSGAPGDWAIYLGQPSRLRWGHFLLPEAEAVEVQSDGRHALLKARTGGDTRALSLRAAGAPGLWHGPDAETIPRLAARDSSILLLTGRLLEQLDLPRPEFPPLDEITPSQMENVSSCLSFLREHFPPCSLWIERVLRYLCLVRSPPDCMHSGSFEGHFGFTFMTDRHDPVKLAEMLIHECSHQYFSLLTRFAALTDDDGRLYYSPFVRKERPAERILLAYHAFANVELFYRACVRAGVSVSRSKDAIEQLRPDLDLVERALVSDVSFTPFGRCVMDSLLVNRSRYELTD
ncbi:MAG: HEXXH motif-containing putative peptide modification protein [Pyrinomonadaceae bacterium]